jgi:hypothetical protein
MDAKRFTGASLDRLIHQPAIPADPALHEAWLL